MEQRTLSIRGVGPYFAGLSAIYSAAGVWARNAFPETMTMNFIPPALATYIGAALVAVGVVFFLMAIRTLAIGFPQGVLFTKGAYAACRHPIYGVWVALIVPGLGIMTRSWPIIFVIPLMYITLRLLVKREEAELERLFKQDFLNYKANTPCVFPLLHRIFQK